MKKKKKKIIIKIKIKIRKKEKVMKKNVKKDVYCININNSIKNLYLYILFFIHFRTSYIIW
jgi:hypothetical protein